MRYFKYHGLGNDYLVIEPKELGRELTTAEIKLICHRNYGAGSDGILWGPLPSNKANFALRIFNPDGSEAEKSGNGLRIFSRFLFDQGQVGQKPFAIETRGGCVNAQVYDNGRLVDIDMGQVSFNSRQIPLTGDEREVINENMTIAGKELCYCAATVGNPHCVIHLDEISSDLAKSLGPQIEVEPRFINRTNVQFMKVLGRNDIQIEIWERGAGYTLASGSSSSAAAAVARRLGLCDEQITVHMPGGDLGITVHEDYTIKMSGPVTKVADGMISKEAFSVDL
ncbi:MAG: diaminopimelate epimerase [Deltaproteobacteria bacterium]|nr:diaminopimelate epimerase [Deltaproteobacteria bacterium]